MAKKKKEAQNPAQEPEQVEIPQEETPQEEVPQEQEVNPWEEKYNAERDAHLRVAADFDNFRRRSQKEKEQAYSFGKADAVEKLLPVYDNLERALQQQTADETFRKGVEMTMTQLVSILSGLGVEIFGQVGDAFDPNLHNAVMHIEDENLGEDVISQVFQKGFKLGDKVVRFAMVQVAN